ncbi:MAG: peptidoglycan DD-metalloendopeptidase family protein [Bifidobacteriaceae bacterium]|nr:peptidoglycan DD-metalloendopeptidase family protein [Bifidobacteriaceae bacterium]
MLRQLAAMAPLNGHGAHAAPARPATPRQLPAVPAESHAAEWLEQQAEIELRAAAWLEQQAAQPEPAAEAWLEDAAPEQAAPVPAAEALAELSALQQAEAAPAVASRSGAASERLTAWLEAARRAAGPPLAAIGRLSAQGLERLRAWQGPGLAWNALATKLKLERVAEPLDRARVFLRCNTERAAAVACAGLLAGTVFIGLGGSSSNAAPTAGADALSPLADTIEVVSRRSMAELTARSMTAQVAQAAAPAETGPAISAATQSNAGLVLNWDTSALAAEPEAVLTLRRGVGDAPPQTPVEGVDVPLGEDPGTVVDMGLQPDTSYSYTLFIQRPGAKPEVLAQVIASTRLYPTELLPGDRVIAGDRLTSPSNTYFVSVDGDGGIVLQNNRNQKLWSLDAEPHPEASLALTQDGALVVSVADQAVWTADAKAAGASLILTDAGALQLLDANAQVVWSSAEQGYQLRGGDSPYAVSADGWTQPGAGPVSSPYGMRLHPIYGVVKLHAGIDMTGSRGKPIYAARDGDVTRVYQDSGGNWTIEIEHPGGIATRYLHMDGLGGILVKEGDEVVAGEQIALTGNSGQSTGPHLHFEVLVAGETTDPVAFLKEHGVTVK